MANLLIGDYLAKLILLEDKVGAKVGYKLFDIPSQFDPRCTIALNKMASEIAQFAGITTPVAVAVTPQAEDKAGHISLSDTPDVTFVEIADDLVDFPECVLATLAHEISHLFLYSNGISCGAGLEFHYQNEILTDITALFLGFGKLMISGCTSEKRFKTPEGVWTHTKTVGYLEPNQLIFVYLIVCSMRGIPRPDFESRLPSPVIKELELCQHEYSAHFFSVEYHNDEFRDALQMRIDRARITGVS